MELRLIELGLKQTLAWKICNFVDQTDKIKTCSIVNTDHEISTTKKRVGGKRSKERDRKTELVLRSTYQFFEWDRNNSDRNFFNVVRYVHIPLVP